MPADATQRAPRQAVALPKVATHVDGLDAVLHGGLPAGRVTLLWGGPGCGKSLLALEWLYRGAVTGEPGILVLFEEGAAAVRQNALTLGWDLAPLEQAGTLWLLEGFLDPAMVLAGDFDLQGLFAVLGGQAQRLGARRVVLDGVDMLTRLLADPQHERNELYALHRWLLDRGLTALLTMKEMPEHGALASYAFLDFMADCVIKLEQHSAAQVNTRRLQVLKYRGSGFGRNEYPYVIMEDGVHLLPISAVALVQQPLGDLVPSGPPGLDPVLGGGYRRGASFLLAGAPGTGKTTLACAILQAACARGEKVLFLAFEESDAAIVANMRSPGIDLRPALQAETLRFHTALPESMGVEEHLFRALHALRTFQPHLVVVDALSSTLRMGTAQAAFEYALRLLLACKERGLTCLFTNQITEAGAEDVFAGVGVSSLADIVVVLRAVERDHTLRRTLLVRKSRGAAASLQVYEFRITDQGIAVRGAVSGARPSRGHTRRPGARGRPGPAR